MNSLPSLRAGLLVHRLDDQALVYDPATDRVHLLDATTARVYEVLATNRPSRSDALAALAIMADGHSTEALLALSIEELRKADLLDRSTVVESSATRHNPATAAEQNRRRRSNCSVDSCHRDAGRKRGGRPEHVHSNRQSVH